jgi:hypothetical protein
MIYSSFHPSERLHYTSMVLLSFAILITSVFRKLIAEDRKKKQLDAAEDEHADKLYSVSIFCAWDNSLTKQSEVDNFSGSLTQGGSELLYFD